MAEFNVDFLPLTMAFTNKDGTLSGAAANYMRSLHNLVSNNFNDHGVHFPTIDGASLALTPTGDLENGATYYDTTDGQPETIIDGVRHKFTTTVALNAAFQLPLIADVTALDTETLTRGTVAWDEATNKARVFNHLGVWEDMH